MSKFPDGAQVRLRASGVRGVVVDGSRPGCSFVRLPGSASTALSYRDDCLELEPEEGGAFRCTWCPGLVTPQKGSGRTRLYKPGLRLPVPDDYEMPTCSGCGETYVSLAESKRLDELQLEMFRRALSEALGPGWNWGRPDPYDPD